MTYGMRKPFYQSIGALVLYAVDRRITSNKINKIMPYLRKFVAQT